MEDEAAERWWGEPGGGPRPAPAGWWPEPDSLDWVRCPGPDEEGCRGPGPAGPAWPDPDSGRTCSPGVRHRRL